MTPLASHFVTVPVSVVYNIVSNLVTSSRSIGPTILGETARVMISQLFVCHDVALTWIGLVLIKKGSWLTRIERR